MLKRIYTQGAIRVIRPAQTGRVATKTAGIKLSNGSIYDPPPNTLVCAVRAISARTNQNYDSFPSQELKKAAHTFIGRPVFVNHNNEDHRRTRGIIVDSTYKEAGSDKYIELLMAVDSKNFPRLSALISTGELDSVSMGTDVEFTRCSYCNHQAFEVEDFCDHVRNSKGQTLSRMGRNGRTERILVSEYCYGLNFFEISWVFDPADETAVLSKVYLPKHAKVASMPRQVWALGETTSPESVDTLREQQNCPQCGDENFDGKECNMCEYVQPHEDLQEPDTMKSRVLQIVRKDPGNEGNMSRSTNMNKTQASRNSKSSIQQTEGKEGMHMGNTPDAKLKQALARKRLADAQQRLAEADMTTDQARESDSTDPTKIDQQFTSEEEAREPLREEDVTQLPDYKSAARINALVARNRANYLRKKADGLHSNPASPAGPQWKPQDVNGASEFQKLDQPRLPGLNSGGYTQKAPGGTGYTGVGGGGVGNVGIHPTQDAAQAEVEKGVPETGAPGRHRTPDYLGKQPMPANRPPLAPVSQLPTASVKSNRKRADFGQDDPDQQAGANPMADPSQDPQGGAPDPQAGAPTDSDGPNSGPPTDSTPGESGIDGLPIDWKQDESGQPYGTVQGTDLDIFVNEDMSWQVLPEGSNDPIAQGQGSSYDDCVEQAFQAAQGMGQQGGDPSQQGDPSQGDPSQQMPPQDPSQQPPPEEDPTKTSRKQQNPGANKSAGRQKNAQGATPEGAAPGKRVDVSELGDYETMQDGGKPWSRDKYDHNSFDGKGKPVDGSDVQNFAPGGEAFKSSSKRVSSAKVFALLETYTAIGLVQNNKTARIQAVAEIEKLHPAIVNDRIAVLSLVETAMSNTAANRPRNVVPQRTAKIPAMGRAANTNQSDADMDTLLTL